MNADRRPRTRREKAADAMRDIVAAKQLERDVATIVARRTMTTRGLILHILESDHPRSRYGGWTVRELWAAMVPSNAPWYGVSLERVRQLLRELELERVVWKVKPDRPARWRLR